MNPYETPANVGDTKQAHVKASRGKKCQECGGINTTTDSILKSKPSILPIILFGWLFIFIRGAFAMRTIVCRDCGASHRYKSLGSWILLCLFLFIATFAIAGFFLPV